MTYSCVTVIAVCGRADHLERLCEDWIVQMRSIGGAVLVVNDGSGDGAARVLDRLIASHPELIAVHQIDSGPGAALMNGYRRALELDPGWLFQLDAEEEMPAHLFPALWAQRHQAPFIRCLPTAMRRNPVDRLVNLLFGVQVANPNLGSRLMSAAAFRPLFAAIPDGLVAPNFYLTLLAARAGLLASGPQWRMESSAGGRPRTAWRHLWQMIQFRLRPATRPRRR